MTPAEPCGEQYGKPVAAALTLGGIVKLRWIGDLFRTAFAYLPRVRDYAWQRRQIVVSACNAYTTAAWDESRWEIRLPGRCAVCGRADDLTAKADILFAADWFWPLWASLTGVVAGVGMALLWRAWYFPILIVIGLVIGYLVRGKKEVQIRHHKCPKHLENEA